MSQIISNQVSCFVYYYHLLIVISFYLFQSAYNKLLLQYKIEDFTNIIIPVGGYTPPAIHLTSPHVTSPNTAKFNLT